MLFTLPLCLEDICETIFEIDQYLLIYNDFSVGLHSASIYMCEILFTIGKRSRCSLRCDEMVMENG